VWSVDYRRLTLDVSSSCSVLAAYTPSTFLGEVKAEAVSSFVFSVGTVDPWDP